MFREMESEAGFDQETLLHSCMRILFANYTGHTRHLGCRATCAALEALLRERFGSDICIEHEKHGVRHGDMHLCLGEAGIALRAAKMRRAPEFALWRSADLVVVNGEGSLHGHSWETNLTRRSRQAANHRLLDILVATRDLQKRVWVVNHSLVGGEKFGAWIKRVYQGVEHIAVREPASRRWAQSQGIENVVQSADAIFSVPRPAPIEGVLAGKVVFTDSARWKRMWNDDLRARVGQLIQHVRSQGLEAVYLSLFSDHRDQQLATQLDLPLCTFDSPAAVMANLASAHMVVTGRFHAAVFSARVAAPFVAFESNTHKIAGLCEMLQYPVASLELETSEISALKTQLDVAMGSRDAAQKHLLLQEHAMCELAHLNVAR